MATCGTRIMRRAIAGGYGVHAVGHRHRHAGQRQLQRRRARLGQRGGGGGVGVVLVVQLGDDRSGASATLPRHAPPGPRPRGTRGSPARCPAPPPPAAPRCGRTPATGVAPRCAGCPASAPARGRPAASPWRARNRAPSPVSAPDCSTGCPTKRACRPCRAKNAGSNGSRHSSSSHRPGNLFTRCSRQAQTCGATYCTRGMPSAADAAEHVQAEAGRVDRHHQVGPSRGDVGHHRQHAAAQQADAGQDLHQAHHRQVGHGKQAGHAFRLHARAGHAGELRIRPGLPERGHQPAAEHVAAGLAGDQVDQRHATTAQGGGGGAVVAVVEHGALAPHDRERGRVRARHTASRGRPWRCGRSRRRPGKPRSIGAEHGGVAMVGVQRCQPRVRRPPWWRGRRSTGSPSPRARAARRTRLNPASVSVSAGTRISQAPAATCARTSGGCSMS